MYRNWYRLCVLLKGDSMDVGIVSRKRQRKCHIHIRRVYSDGDVFCKRHQWRHVYIALGFDWRLFLLRIIHRNSGLPCRR